MGETRKSVDQDRGRAKAAKSAAAGHAPKAPGGRMGRLICTVCIVALGLTAGCAAQSKVERDFGTSYRLAIANQVLDPEAGQNPVPVEGMAGDAAERVYEKYTGQFGKPGMRSSSASTAGSQGDRSR